MTVSTLEYRGYTARVTFDARDDIFVGRVLGVRDIISFHADTVADLHKEFQVSIDDYLANCEEMGVTPDRPASGKLLLRISPQTHSAALVAAQSAGKSLNQWVAEVLEAAVSA
jgi:predicted HicB family RNase H-like nuclease